jgi:Raf kinase inhibitor-like YbhB/YbcL family protein
MSIASRVARYSLITIAASLTTIACSPAKPPAEDAIQSKRKDLPSFQLSSPAFSNNQSLPSRFACEGAGVSPPLTFSDLPPKTKTVAIILEDPDAPKGTYIHWLMWNWPAAKTEIPDALPTKPRLDSGAIQGTGSNGKIGYNPPCPPGGTHRYYFKAYALDTTLNIPSPSDKQALLIAMQGHVLGQALLMGTHHKH